MIYFWNRNNYLDNHLDNRANAMKRWSVIFTSLIDRKSLTFFVFHSISNNSITFAIFFFCGEIVMKIYRSYSRGWKLMRRYIARKEVTRHAILWIAREQIEYNEHYNAPCPTASLSCGLFVYVQTRIISDRTKTNSNSQALNWKRGYGTN